MAKRKTFNVDDYRERMNKALLTWPDEDENGRRAICTVLEDVLMKTGNYAGFGYVNTRGEAVVPDEDPRYTEYRRHYYKGKG